MFIDDDKLPLDVFLRKYSDSRHALCCLEGGYEEEFDRSLAGSIGRPLALCFIILASTRYFASG
jgi:hypothetical protein